MGVSNSPTRITQPTMVPRLISIPKSRCRMALCRYSGRESQYLNNRIDHHLVANQRLLDDPLRQGRRYHASLLALLAGALLALGHQHKVFRRIDIQLLAFLVADHRRFPAAAAAPALLRRAGHDLLHPRQILRQGLPARMLAPWFPACGFRLALALGLDFGTADARLQLQQLQLLVGELFAARPILRNPLLT